jgi:hypothetical protein
MLLFAGLVQHELHGTELIAEKLVISGKIGVRYEIWLTGRLRSEVPQSINNISNSRLRQFLRRQSWSVDERVEDTQPGKALDMY